MKKTYAQVIEQIEALKAEADKLRKQEVAGVVARIRDAVAHYGLTAADLGMPAASIGKLKPGPKAGAGKFRTKAGVSTTKAAKAPPTVKFRNEAGQVWGGRGPRPQWLRQALLAGKTLKDFAVT